MPPFKQTWTITEPYLNLRCGLGEGPYYEREHHSLRFVDILKKRLHAVDLSAGPGSATTLQLDTPISVTADIEGCDPSEGLLIGAKYGLAVLNRKEGQYQYYSRLNASGHENERLRTNDGAVDPHGRFWLGTMTDFGLGAFEREGETFHFLFSSLFTS